MSAGTVTTAYRRAGIDPAWTTRLYARGRPMARPTGNRLQTAWEIEGTYRGVGQQFGVTASTAKVWLAEVGIYADPVPALSRAASLDAISAGRRSMKQIAADNQVTVTTVRVELHRHQLFDTHRNRHRKSSQC